MVINLFTAHNSKNGGTLLSGGSWFYVSGPATISGIAPGNPVPGIDPAMDFTNKVGGTYIFQYTIQDVAGDSELEPGILCESNSLYTVVLSETADLNLYVTGLNKHCCFNGVAGDNTFTAELVNESDAGPYLGSATYVWKIDEIVQAETSNIFEFTAVCDEFETQHTVKVEVTTPCNPTPLTQSLVITTAPTLYNGTCTNPGPECEGDICVDLAAHFSVIGINNDVIDEYRDNDIVLDPSQRTNNGIGHWIVNNPNCVDFTGVPVGVHEFSHQQRYTLNGFNCAYARFCDVTVNAGGTGGTPSNTTVCGPIVRATVDFYPDPKDSPTNWHFIATVFDPPFTCSAPVYDWLVNGVSQAVNALIFDIPVGGLAPGNYTIGFSLTCTEGVFLHEVEIIIP